MRDKKVAVSMKENFSAIRKAIEKMQDGVIKATCRAADANYEDSRIYATDYLRGRVEARRESTTQKILAVKEETKTIVISEFAKVEMKLRDWLAQPMPEDCSALLGAFLKYGLTPSRREIELLAETGKGNYLGSRVVAEISAKAGFADDNFVPIDELYDSLSKAKRLALASIADFAGRMNERTNQYVSLNDLGLDICENNFMAPIAERFLEDDTNDFASIEKMLTELTTPQLTLLPSKRAALDEMFRDCADDDERIAVIASAIERSDRPLCDLLALHSPDLYRAATEREAERQKERIHKALQEQIEAKREQKSAVESYNQLRRQAQA